MASDMWRSAGKHRCGSSKHSPGCTGGSRRILGVNIRIGQAAHGPKLLGEHEGKRQDAPQAISNCFTDIISIGKLDPGSALDFFSFRSGG